MYGDANTPRKRFGYLSLPRKNSKSYLAAILGLYHLVADGEQGAEVYVVRFRSDAVAVGGVPVRRGAG